MDWLRGFFSDYEVWATFIAALMGFAGIIVTLIVQRDFDRRSERERLEADRLRLIAALQAEMIGVREYGQGATEHLSDQDEFLFPKVPPFFIFEGLVQKMDLLTIEQVQALRHCYAWLREIPSRLGTLQPPDSQCPEGYIRVPAGRFEIVKTLFSHLVEYSNEALRALGWQDPK